MRSANQTVDIPIGHVELFGLVLHVVEHGGRLIAACPDDNGRVVAALTEPALSACSCRRLMRSAVDLLLTAAETGLSQPASVAASAPCGADRNKLPHLRAADCAKGMNRRRKSIFPG